MTTERSFRPRVARACASGHGRGDRSTSGASGGVSSTRRHRATRACGGDSSRRRHRRQPRHRHPPGSRARVEIGEQHARGTLEANARGARRLGEPGRFPSPPVVPFGAGRRQRHHLRVVDGFRPSGKRFTMTRRGRPVPGARCRQARRASPRCPRDPEACGDSAQVARASVSTACEAPATGRRPVRKFANCVARPRQRAEGFRSRADPVAMLAHGQPFRTALGVR